MLAFLRAAGLACALLLALSPLAEARTYTLRCEGRFSYTLTFESLRPRLTINVEGMRRLLKIRQLKEDDEGFLIWGATPSFGGERDMLIRLGGPKAWVRTYFRNGSEETINCRQL